VAQGTPEQVARNKRSYTGQVLSRVLNGNQGNGSGDIAPVSSTAGSGTARQTAAN
jgi:hypothetical protein